MLRYASSCRFSEGLVEFDLTFHLSMGRGRLHRSERAYGLRVGSGCRLYVEQPLPEMARQASQTTNLSARKLIWKPLSIE
jgi:hypothetical protein